MSRYQKGKSNLDFTEARDSEWQRHQLGHMQVCTSFQTDNHASIAPLSFLQAGCPSCRPTNSVKALTAFNLNPTRHKFKNCLAPAPLKLRLYGTIQICLLLLLVLFFELLLLTAHSCVHKVVHNTEHLWLSSFLTSSQSS